MRVALGRDEASEQRAGLAQLGERLTGHSGLLFTARDTADMEEMFALHEDLDFARPGQKVRLRLCHTTMLTLAGGDINGCMYVTPPAGILARGDSGVTVMSHQSRRRQSRTSRGPGGEIRFASCHTDGQHWAKAPYVRRAAADKASGLPQGPGRRYVCVTPPGGTAG
eukprot:1981830-Pyramimonas_sp.AAC.1